MSETAAGSPAARHIPPSSSAALWRGVGALTLLRFAGDTAIRAPVPFVIFIAASYGAQPESAGWLAVALGLSGLVSPLAGAIERRLGSRRAILVSTALFASGCFALAIAPTFGVALILCVVLSLGRSLIGPQAQAYVADSVPFHRRGAVLGVLEMAWALSWIIGVPVFGFLVQRSVWWLPFWAIGALSLVGAWATLRFAITHDHARALAAIQTRGIGDVIADPRARRVLLYGFGLVMAMSSTVIVYAPHLVRRFGLTAEQLGLVSIALGVADVVAEFLVIFALDRLGKRRSVLFGGAVMAFGLIGFLVSDASLVLSIAALFFVFLGFEYAIVSMLPIASEVLPSARTAVMGSFNGANAVSRTLAGVLALPLYGAIGLPGTLLISLASLGLALVAFGGIRLDERPRPVSAAASQEG